MIETKILDAAVGIQRQDVIDKSETTVLPSLANGVMAGHFKRGRMDKPFKVTAKNYKALLGHDPSNPSYLSVEDAFKRGVSEISILRVGGTGVACIASHALINESLDSEFGEWITVSRNGGEFKSFDLSTDDYEPFARMVYLGQDGKSLAFLDYEYQIDPEVLGGGQMLDGDYVRDSLYYNTFCGIASNGMLNTPTGNYELKSTGINYPSIGGRPPLDSNNNITRAEHNWLVFKPTPDTDPDFDFFYKMGASGDTIEIHSCAVVEPYIDPNVCQPTFFTMKINTNNEIPIVGDVHAKYRINGEAWEHYTAPASDWNPVLEFLGSIFHNDWPMFNISGGGGRGAFNKSYRGSDIYGAESAPPFTRDQDDVVSLTPYTIEFAVTENNDNDLVYLAFGQDITMKSCAIGNWMGY